MRNSDSKKLRAVTLILGMIAAVSVAVAAVNYRSGGSYVSIYKDGKLFRKIPLDVSAPIEVKIGDGNVAMLENGCVSMISADCPDQLCVNQGKISSTLFPIVCLPNRVVIQIEKAD